MKNFIRKILRENDQEKPKVGEYLYCIRELKMNQTGEVAAKEGNRYVIIRIRGNSIAIRDELGHEHWFSLEHDTSYYGIWFSIIPKDIRDMDFFKGLYESEEFDWIKELPEEDFNNCIIYFDPPLKKSADMQKFLDFIYSVNPKIRWNSGRKLNDPARLIDERWNDILGYVGIIDERCFRSNEIFSTKKSVYGDKRRLEGNKLMKEFRGNIKEQEEDDLGWAREIILQPAKALVEDAYYRVDNKQSYIDYNLDIHVTEFKDNIVIYDSRCDASDENEYERYNNDNVGIPKSQAIKLVDKSYWIPINKEDTLFNDSDYLNESDEPDWFEDVVNSEMRPTKIKDIRVGMHVLLNGKYNGITFENSVGQVVDSNHVYRLIVFDNWFYGHNDQHRSGYEPNPKCTKNNCYWFGDGNESYLRVQVF